MKKILIRIGIAIGLPLLAIVLALNMVLSSIDKGQYQRLLEEKVQTATGRRLVVGSAPRVGIFPALYLEFSDLLLASPEENPVTAPIIQAAAVRLNIPWLEAFSKAPAVSAITLYSPSVEIQRDRSGEIIWSGLPAAFIASLQPNKEAGSDQVSAMAVIHVENGKFAYINHQNSTRETIEKISMRVEKKADASLAMAGNGLFRGDPTQFSITYSAAKEGPFAFAVEQSDGGKIVYEGVNKSTEESFRAEGTVRAAAPDLGKFLFPAEGVADKGAFVSDARKAALQAKMAVSVEGGMTLREDGFSIADAAIKLGTDTGRLAASFSLAEKLPDIVLDIKLEQLHFSQWVGYARLFAEEGKVSYSTDSEDGYADFRLSQRLFPSTLILKMQLTAGKLDYGTRTYEKFKADAEIAEGLFTLHEISIALPGNGRILAFGVVTRPMQGLRFEGSLEAKGEKLKDALMFFDSTAAVLPEQSFGEYSVRSNLFISHEFLRLSEADLMIGDLRLDGGLVTHFEATPRLEADIKFKGTNLDYFRDVWREGKQASSKSDFDFLLLKGTEFSWLKSLDYIIDFTINLEDFTFLEHKGQTAAMRLYARKNEIDLIGLRMYFPEGPLDGTFKLDVSHTVPYVTATVSAPFLDAQYFSSDLAIKNEPLIDLKVEPKQWSTELFDFSWMTNFSGDFDISATKFLYAGIPLDMFRLRASLKDQSLSAHMLQFEQLGGRVDIKGALLGSKVPGLSLNVALYNVDIAKLLQDFPGLGMIGGRASINARIVTSGIHLLSWITQAEAKITLAARGVKVEGFNLEGVVGAVRTARSTADVVTSVNSLMRQGHSEFSVDGAINLVHGVARTPGLALKTGSVTGTISGEIAVLPYKFNASSIFYFPQLSAEKPPSLAIDMAGPIENFAVETDSSSLESWVAKRMISK